VARIAGVELKNNLVVVYALSEIYGIGPHNAKKILKQVKVDETKRAKDLMDWFDSFPQITDKVKLYE
jgi:ribosomal protein S13